MHNYRCAIWRVPVRCQGHTDTPSPYEPQARHARSDVGHRGAWEIPPDVHTRTAAPAPQRSPRLPPHRFPLAAPTLRSPGGATTQTEKSTPVHTSNPPSAGGRSSPCGVPCGPCHTALPGYRGPRPNPLPAPGLRDGPVPNTTGDVGQRSARGPTPHSTPTFL